MIDLKPSELRIGNWISPKLDGNTIAPRKVLGLTENGAVIQFGITLQRRTGEISYSPEPKREVVYSDLVGIPLTKELLEGCGFFFSDGDDQFNSYDKEPLSVVIKSDGEIITFLEDRELDCTYLHELQNLYFALTKEEIIVNV